MVQAITVTGPVSDDELGQTMCHVHLLINIRMSEPEQYRKVETASEAALRDKPANQWTFYDLGTIRRNVRLVKDNWILGDVDEMIGELMLYKRMGGTSVVECTVSGIGRDPLGLMKIAGATGVNVICSTGFYVSPTHPEFVKTSTVDDLCAHMVRELTVGIDDTGIRAGVLKNALSCPMGHPDVPFTGDEEKVLRATARAQAETGSAVEIHPAGIFDKLRHHKAYLDVLEQEGANLEKVQLCHFGKDPDIDYIKSLLDRGASISFDQLGSLSYQAPGRGNPSDGERVQQVVALVEAGYTNQILLSNEVVHKSRLRKYGGYGYAHVLEYIVPDLKFYGVTDEQIKTMLVENPKRLYPF
ncbi:phosphotriesterase [Chloroflexota bacterium]